jgi:hypothetical protein
VRQKEAAHIKKNGAEAVGLGIISQSQIDQILFRASRKEMMRKLPSRSDRKQYKKDLNIRARTILEFDSQPRGEFVESNEILRNDSENDPWA